MGTLSRISSVVAIAFAATIPFIACSDSNSTSAFGENPQAYSEPALESSSSVIESSAPESSETAVQSLSANAQSSSSRTVTRSSSSKATLLVNGKECTAENEGAVGSVLVQNGSPMMTWNKTEVFYRCEDGAWVEGDYSLKCDTTGVSVGDTCSITDVMMGLGPVVYSYIYEGNGVWIEGGIRIGASSSSVVQSSSSEVILLLNDKECTAENEGVVDSVLLYNNLMRWVVDKSYYRCEKSAWVEGNRSLTCDTIGVPVGGACTIKDAMVDHGPMVFIYIYEGNGLWKPLNIQIDAPKKCTAENEGADEKFIFGNKQKSDTLSYKCFENKWVWISEEGCKIVKGSLSNVDPWCEKMDYLNE